jgi:glycosyltransferase involved in cell wall biosynthesis
MLTIYIPTYNRVKHLQLLLSSIFFEIDQNPELREFFIIKVFNNASSDTTAEYLVTINRSNFIFVNRPLNVGPRINVGDAINQCCTKFLWVLGDDDIPFYGFLTLLKKFICNNNPNLVYIPAVWTADVFRENICKISDSSVFMKLSSSQFIVKTGAKITFISSYIINFEFFQIEKLNSDINFAINTDFPHLSFLAPALLRDDSIFAFGETAICATGNTKFQYSLIDAFGVDLPNLIERLFAGRQDIVRRLLVSLLKGYLPSFIYSVKFNNSGDTSVAIPWRRMFPSLSKYWQFWIFIYPLKLLPKYLALPLVVLGRLFR